MSVHYHTHVVMHTTLQTIACTIYFHLLDTWFGGPMQLGCFHILLWAAGIYMHVLPGINPPHKWPLTKVTINVVWLLSHAFVHVLPRDHILHINHATFEATFNSHVYSIYVCGNSFI